MGRNLSILPWLLGAVVVLSGGYLSQRLKSKGVSSRVSRGVLACATVVLGGCTLPFVALMPTPALKIAVLVFGGAIGSTIYVVLPMIVSELTPQPQRAAMLAITTSIVTLAGVLSPLVMGVDHPERRDADRRLRDGLCDPGRPAAGRRHHRPAVHPPRGRSQAARRARHRRSVARRPTRPRLKEREP